MQIILHTIEMNMKIKLLLKSYEFDGVKETAKRLGASQNMYISNEL